VSSNHKVEETQARVNSLLKLWEELRKMSDQVNQVLGNFITSHISYLGSLVKWYRLRRLYLNYYLKYNLKYNLKYLKYNLKYL
jgi:hypothetical protein